MKQFIIIRNILLILILPLLISGCGRKPVPDTNVSWQNEIKEAASCGMDGLKCCPDTNPACLYGQQCCTSPEYPADNFCSDDCACGQENKFCCPGEKCGDGLTCANGRCLKCGQEKKLCCADDKCGRELICYQGRCAQCGIAGNPCCAKQPFCLDENAADSKRAECQNGLCRRCGAEDNIVCLDEPACNDKHLANNGFCLRCGGFNNPCCDKNISGYECDPENGLICKLGFCDKK